MSQSGNQGGTGQQHTGTEHNAEYDMPALREAARKAVQKNMKALIVLEAHKYDQWLNAVHMSFALCKLEGLLPGPAHDPILSADPVLQRFGMALLLPTLSPKDQQQVLRNNTVQDCIDAVRTHYHGTRRIQQVNLLVDLFSLSMAQGESIADVVDKMERLEREMSDAGIALDPLIAPIRVLTAVSKLDKYMGIANVVLGSDAPITMKAVHQAMRAVEVTNKGASKPTGQAFAVQPADVRAKPAASAQLSQKGKQPALASDPTATALASLAKAVNRMQDRMERADAQQKRQQQGAKSASGPERAEAQPVQRKQPYAPHNRQESACYNCGLTGHGFAKCRSKCSVCGGKPPVKGGHSAHKCPSRGGAAANVACTGTVTAGVTGAAFVGMASDAAPSAAGLPRDMPSPFLDPMPSPFLDLPFAPQQYPEEIGHPGRYRGPKLINGPPGARAPGMGNGFSPFLSKCQWFLDSGASHHMTPCREYLQGYVADPDTSNQVRGIGNNPLVRAGTGTLEFCTVVQGQCYTVQLHNVWHVPDLPISLLSGQQLRRDGFWTTEGGPGDPTVYVVDGEGRCVLECPHTGIVGTLNIPTFKPRLCVFQLPRGVEQTFPYHQVVNPRLKRYATPIRFTPPVYSQSTLDRSGVHCSQQEVNTPPKTDGIEAVSSYSSASHSTDQETPELWHQRLGHMNYQSLYHLVKTGKLGGINLPASAFQKCHSDRCEVCVMAKHRRAAALSKVDRPQSPMDTIHSDVCCYSEVGLDGSRYAVTMYDDHTQYAGCATLTSKAAVDPALRAGISRWEAETGRKCRKLVTDRGGEYLGLDFYEWLSSKGIIHEKTVPKEKGQNGKAERLNQSMNDIARSLLLQYNLDKRLWPYAVLEAVRLYNLGMHKPLGMSKYEAFKGTTPDVKNCRIFGCRVFARIPDCQRSKMDPKSEIGIYLGPAKDGPGYLVLRYRPDLKRSLKYSVGVYRDVVTYELLTDACKTMPVSAARWGGDLALPAPLTEQQVQRYLGETPEGIEADSLSTSMVPLTVSSLQQLLGEAVEVEQDQEEDGDALAPPAIVPLTDKLLDSDWVPQQADVPVVNPGQATTPPQQVRVVPSGSGSPAPNPLVGGQPYRVQPVFFEDAEDIDMAAMFGVSVRATTTGKAFVVLQDVGTKKVKVRPSPVPFEHVVVPPPRSGPVVPVTAAKDYYQNRPFPSTPKEAMNSPFAQQWLEAMQAEFDSLLVNQTWELVPQTGKMKVIPCRWVMVIKYDADGNVLKFKARLVAGGHRQTEGIDFDETYAPVSRGATQKTFLSEAAWQGWSVHQLDITTAFLNGEIDLVTYMKQPPGFAEGVNLVCKLQKCLYGLKQAPRVWYHTLKQALQKLGFQCVNADASFWVRPGEAMVYLTTVVDDMLIASPNEGLTLQLVDQILARFKGVKGGLAHLYNGYKLQWDRPNRSVYLTQQRHIQDAVAKFKPLAKKWVERPYFPLPKGLLMTADGVKGMPPSPLLDVLMYPYRSLVGVLNYIAWSTRPDIAYAVTQLSRWGNAPTVLHWKLALRVLEYLDATKDQGIRLGGSPVPVCAYVDSSHGTGTADGYPVRGHVLMVRGGPVLWASKTIKLTTTSTTESEYRAMSECAKEAIWLCQVLTLFGVPHRPFPIKGDNKGALDAVNNHAITAHTRHIELHVHFIRERVEAGQLVFSHVPGTDNPADIFTKALGSNLFQAFKLMLGVMAPR